MAVVKNVLDIVISKKYKTIVETDDVLYFPSIADVESEQIDNNGVYFIDGSTTLTAADMQKLAAAGRIGGSFTTDQEKIAPIKNTLNIKDYSAEDISVTELTNFLNVNLTKTSLADVQIVKETEVTQKVKGDDVTETCKIAGAVKMTDSAAGNITNYKTVTLTNSSAGNILLDNLAKEYYELDEEPWDIDRRREYTAAGAVTVKADKKAVFAPEAQRVFTVGDISGYLNVTLTGYTDKKVPANDIVIKAGIITGGSSVYEREDMTESETRSVAGSLKITDGSADEAKGFNAVTLKNADITGAVSAFYKVDSTFYGEIFCSSLVEKMSDSSSSFSYSITAKSAGSFSLNNGTVGAEVTGFKSVSVTAGSISGEIDFGDIFTVSYKETYGKTSTQTLSYKETANGSLTFKDSRVAGEISGYNTVKLVNSSAADISNWNLSYSAQTKMDEFGYTADKATLEDKASGAFTMTVDKKAETDLYSAASVTGYDKVTISGYSAKDGDKSVAVNGDIRGGKLKVTGTTDGQFGPGMFAFKESDAVYTVSASVTLSKNVSVDGNIIGYGKVSLAQAQVAGGISAAPDYNDFYQALSSDAEVKGTSVTMTDAIVGGDITGYKQLNVTKGDNSAASFVGTSDNDTFKLAKNTTLYIGSVDLGAGAKDKMTIDGTLYVGTLEGVDAFAGKGTVYASTAAAEALSGSGFKGTVVDLGANYAVFENADDRAMDAFEWDGTDYAGWLGKGVDEADFIKFTAVEGQKLQISGDFTGGAAVLNGETLLLDGSAIELAAGEYTLSLTCSKGNIDYSVALVG